MTSNETRRRRRWGKFLLVLGLLLVLFAGVVTAKRLAFLAHAQSAPGVVVEMVRMGSGRTTQRGSGASAPRVSFVVGAVAREFVSPVGSYPPAFSVGEAVRVLYDADDPGHAEVDSVSQLWGPVMVSGVLGVILSVFGVWLMRTPGATLSATRARART